MEKNYNIGISGMIHMRISEYGKGKGNFEREYQSFYLKSRVFANGPGKRGSIPGRVVPKTQKMVLDAASLNTQHYKVKINGRVEQSREWSSPLLILGVVTIEKGAFGSSLTIVANVTYWNW